MPISTPFTKSHAPNKITLLKRVTLLLGNRHHKYTQYASNDIIIVDVPLSAQQWQQQQQLAGSWQKSAHGRGPASNAVRSRWSNLFAHANRTIAQAHIRLLCARTHWPPSHAHTTHTHTHACAHSFQKSQRKTDKTNDADSRPPGAIYYLSSLCARERPPNRQNTKAYTIYYLCARV